MSHLAKISVAFLFALALSFPANLLADDHMDEGSDSKQTMKPKPVEEGSGTSAVHTSSEGDHKEYKDKHGKEYSKAEGSEGKNDMKGEHDKMKDTSKEHRGGMEEGSGGSRM